MSPLKGAIAHAAFLLAAAGLAAYVWIDRWTPRGDAPVMLQAEVDELESITYRWPQGETRVLREGRGKARVYVVTLTHSYDPAAEARKAAAMADPSTRMALKSGADPKEIEAKAIAAAPAQPLVTETKTFPPGLFPIAAIQKLTPFRARRSLGEVPDAELATMGLVAPQRALRVAARGREVALDVGNETFGGQAYYARMPGSDEVFLLDAETVRSFETTPRNMMDSRIVAVPLADVTALELESGGRRAAFVHVNKDQFRARYFAREDSPERKSEAVEGLNSTFVGLKAAQFIDAAPPGEELALIRFLRGSDAPHEVQLLRNADGSGYTLRSGRWIAPVPEADARKILEEVRAAL
ncbi:MAG TPA: DUF4340 domain-containing protein [Verrucomicrobiae bacterium]|nr:DUF4340 domain-containing protein [Verrucomicrobiae bacterium]